MCANLYVIIYSVIYDHKKRHKTSTKAFNANFSHFTNKKNCKNNKNF